MKQIFIDKSQSVVIKVFTNSSVIEREICGVQSLSKIAHVPHIEKLDTKVAKISFLSGFLGYQVPEEQLNMLVSLMLLRKNALKIPVDTKFSIFSEMKKMKKILREKNDLLMLAKIEKNIRRQPLVPVHGDLQKQNMIIFGGAFGLIDFEHFVFAPKELEVVNSLFFNDGNCLDIPSVIGLLPQGFFNLKMMQEMTQYYALKQLILGMNSKEVIVRLNKALEMIARLGKRHVLEKSIQTNSGSFCYV